MSLTLKDVFAQADFLVSEKTGLSIYPQGGDEEDETLEYDSGDIYLEVSLATPVESTPHGTIIFLGTEYRAYVSQQIKFNQEV